MSDQIKSIDLCDRCAYSFQHCIELIKTQPRPSCLSCEMYDGKCKCSGIEFNTPCPYFKEANDGKGD